MQRKRIAQPAGGVGEQGRVCVSRDGDDRTEWAMADAARDPVVATVSGGRKQPLPGPMLAVIVDCTAIVVPAGVRFGHECAHGEGPHPIRVVVHEDGTDRDAYQLLYSVAERVAQSATGRHARAVRRAVRRAAVIHVEEESRCSA